MSRRKFPRETGGRMKIAGDGVKAATSRVARAGHTESGPAGSLRKKMTRRRGLGFLVYASSAGRRSSPTTRLVDHLHPDPQPTNFVLRQRPPAPPNEANQDNPGGGFGVSKWRLGQTMTRRSVALHDGDSTQCLQHPPQTPRRPATACHGLLLPALDWPLEHFPQHDDLPDRRRVA